MAEGIRRAGVVTELVVDFDPKIDDAILVKRQGSGTSETATYPRGQQPSTYNTVSCFRGNFHRSAKGAYINKSYLWLSFSGPCRPVQHKTSCRRGFWTLRSLTRTPWWRMG